MTKKMITDIYLDRYLKYNESDFKIAMEGIGARNYDFISSNTGFRKIIVQEWMDKVLGELPTLQRKSSRNRAELKEIEFDFVDEVADAFEATLAYGYTFVLPEMRGGELVFTTLIPPHYKDIQYVYDDINAKLLYLSYQMVSNVQVDDKTIKEITFKHIHTFDNKNGTYTYSIIDLSNDNEVHREVALDSRMKPFICSTRKSESVWQDADSLIQDIDAAYSEMMLDMQLSRKMIVLPESFIDNIGAKASLTKTPYISQNARIFRSYPTGIDNEEQKPIVFDGHFSPDPYINTINIIAHKISLKTGFGKGYFSYDKIEGFKTATEIAAGRNDMNLAKTRINNILLNIVKTMLIYKYPNSTEDDFVITVADSVLEDVITFKNKAFLDRQAGFINNDAYLKLTYIGYDIDKLKPNEDDIEPEVVGGKQLNGVSGKVQQNIFSDNSQTKS